ncbi:MAG: TolC family protein [Bacteroidia bacterium]
MKNIRFAIAFFLNSLFVSAQQTYSLRQCIDIALENNISLKQQQIQMQSSQADALQSKLNALPSINGSATNNWQTGFAINPRTNLPEEGVTFRTNSFGLSANMPLFNGFQNTNNIRLQQTNLQASKFDVEAARNNIMLNVCNAYMRVLLNIELQQAAKSRVEATRKQLERQEALYNLGSSNKTRLLQIKAQLAAEELAYVNTENQTMQSYTDLWLLLNLKPSETYKIEKITVPENALSDEPRSIDAIYEEFSKVSPEVKSTEQRMRASEIQRLTALGSRSPRLNLSASISSFFTTQNTEQVGTPTFGTPREIGYWLDNNNLPVPVYVPTFVASDIRVKPFEKQISQNFGSVLGFSLQVPVFNGWSVNTNIQKASLNMQNAKLNNKQSLNNLYRNIAQAYTDFKAAYKRHQSNMVNFDASKEAYELAEKQFELGALNIVEYLNTKNNFIRAESDLAQAKFELIFRRKVLDFYLGKPLY